MPSIIRKNISFTDKKELARWEKRAKKRFGSFSAMVREGLRLAYDRADPTLHEFVESLK